MTRDTITPALALATGWTSDFDMNPRSEPGVACDTGKLSLRDAAVLIAIEDHPSGDRIVLTKRASHLAHHPGQIALPGGKVEPADAGPEAAALREAEEEIGLDRRHVRVLGRLARHETVTGFRIFPVVGRIENGFRPVAEPGEVEEVFFVPLAHILCLANYRVEERIWRGRMRRFYTVPYGPHYIWGATARILRGLAERVKTCG